MGKPQRILVLRHAEKDDGSWTLSSRGQTRAAALEVFLRSVIKEPDFIFATHDTQKSERPVETITPYATAVGVEIHTDYKDDEYADLVAELGKPKFDGKQIVICWHHGKISELVAALGVENPPKWQDNVFDRFWLIEFPGGEVSARYLAQRLLFGDSAG